MSACGSSLLMAKPYYGRWDGKPPSSGNGQIAVQRHLALVFTISHLLQIRLLWSCLLWIRIDDGIQNIDSAF
ncbi:hypothetical protein OUZ56_026661 [Daphnia magna]|uniref:Uncharacterized protein n=1 Tax=Daphnia magna TaxID=35525 RepID=A0ABQ9ZMG7_9CRUS|nr:hypothetical protein OUZ56_026661 [Daphnia magna]